MTFASVINLPAEDYMDSDQFVDYLCSLFEVENFGSFTILI